MFNRKKRIIKKLRKLGKHELKKGQNFEDFLFIDDIDSITGNRDDIRCVESDQFGSFDLNK